MTSARRRLKDVVDARVKPAHDGVNETTLTEV